MKKSAFISDIFFAFFIGFLCAICFFRSLALPLFLSFFLALVCGFLTATAVGAFLQSRRKNVLLKKKDEMEKEKLMLHLALLSDEQKTRYFLNALSKNTSIQRFAKLRIFTPTEFYFLKFSLLPTNADEIASLSRLKTGKKKILLCAQIEESARALCEKLNVEVKTADSVYTLLKQENALPNEYLGDSAQTRKSRLQVSFAKSNGKRFLKGGALVLFTSLFVPFPHYYLICGGLLLVTAVLIKIFGKE